MTEPAKRPGCVWPILLSLILGFFSVMCFFVAGGSIISAWGHAWEGSHSPEDVAMAHSSVVVGIASIVLMVVMWVMHFLAPRLLYTWKTLGAVVLGVILGSIVMSQQYDQRVASLKAELARKEARKARLTEVAHQKAAWMQKALLNSGFTACPSPWYDFLPSSGAEGQGWVCVVSEKSGPQALQNLNALLKSQGGQPIKGKFYLGKLEQPVDLPKLQVTASTSLYDRHSANLPLPPDEPDKDPAGAAQSLEKERNWWKKQPKAYRSVIAVDWSPMR